MHTIDRCDSHKQDCSTGVSNKSELVGSYFLPCVYINKFQDEVKSHIDARQQRICQERGAANVEVNDNAFAVLGHEEDNQCASNWKAANGKEHTPATKGVFEQTGIFACLCRHGIVEFLMEMVQCGKQFVLTCYRYFDCLLFAGQNLDWQLLTLSIVSMGRAKLLDTT
jgi:hypothetical protein